jgi:NADPH2:quinone reductase
MKRIRIDSFGDANPARVEEFTPDLPHEHEVRIQVLAAGVNPADTYVRTGTYHFLRPALPYTPGVDAAGVVDAVGAAVTSVALGDRVFVAGLGWSHSGTASESVVCDARAVRPLPDYLSYAQGAALGLPWMTAYRALFQCADLRAGQSVLVHGATGGVGLPVTQMAIAAGATVIGTGGTDDGLALLRELGCASVLNHSATSHQDNLRAAVGDAGVNTVIEMAADHNLDIDAGVLASGGHVVVVGSRGPIEFNARKLMAVEGSVRGTAVWNMSEQERREALDAVSAFLQSHQARVPIGAEYPLAEVDRAYRDVVAQPSIGKLVLKTDAVD